MPITLQALPEDRRSVVTDHELRSEDDAVSLVEDLQNAAEAASAQERGGGRCRRGERGRRIRRPERGRSGRSGRRVAAIERAQPRALRPRPGRGAADLRLRVGVRRARRRGREPLADLRRLLLRDLPGRARLPALPAAQRRPLPVPARRAAGRHRPGDALPDRREPRPRPGQLVRRRAGPVHGDDRPAQGLPRARALPVPDRHGRAVPPAPAAGSRDRGAGQRRVPRDRHRPARLPARRAREDRRDHLPGQLPAREARGARGRGAADRGGDPAAAQAPRADAGRLGRGDGAARLHPRPGQLADVLRRLPGADLHGDEPVLVRRHRLPDVPRRRVVLRLDGRARR